MGVNDPLRVVSISLLGIYEHHNLFVCSQKSSCGRRHTLEQQWQLQQTRVKVRREWKVKS